MTLIEKINPETFIFYKDEKNEKGQLGIEQNRIVEVPNFVSPDLAESMVRYFEHKSEMWGPIAFYGSSGMGLQPGDPDLSKFNLSDNFFTDISNKFKEAVEVIFNKEVRANTSHAQKWDVGGFASPHSDNSDFEGEPNAFEINKYVGVLYLNDDYDGGELYFPEHDISIRPTPFSFISFPGGIENIHGVSEITRGTRYTMVSFWDYADAEYSEEKKKAWDEELVSVREEQAKQREAWESGDKFA